MIPRNVARVITCQLFSINYLSWRIVIGARSRYCIDSITRTLSFVF